MKRTTLAVAALCVVCLVGFVAASSAEAVPRKGEFVSGAGKALTKNRFVGESLLAATFEQKGGAALTCSGATWIGTVSSTSSGVLTEVLTGCTITGKACSTAGKAPGIVALGLTLTVVNESAENEKKEADYLLLETPEAIISCVGAVTIKVKGDYLVPALPEGKLQEAYSYSAKSGAKGTGSQVPELSKAQVAAKIPHFQMSITEIGGGAFANAGVAVEQMHTKYEELAQYL